MSGVICAVAMFWRIIIRQLIQRNAKETNGVKGGTFKFGAANKMTQTQYAVDRWPSGMATEN